MTTPVQTAPATVTPWAASATSGGGQGGGFGAGFLDLINTAANAYTQITLAKLQAGQPADSKPATGVGTVEAPATVNPMQPAGAPAWLPGAVLVGGALALLAVVVALVRRR